MRIAKRWYQRGRSIYMECRGDVENCCTMFRQRYGNIATILVILRILIVIWELWSKMRVEVPPEIPRMDMLPDGVTVDDDSDEDSDHL